MDVLFLYLIHIIKCQLSSNFWVHYIHVPIYFSCITGSSLLTLLLSFIWQVTLRGLVKQLVQCCSTTPVHHLPLCSMSNEGLLGSQLWPLTTSLLEAHTPEETRPARARQVMLKGWTWTKLGSQNHMQQTSYLLPWMVAVAIGRFLQSTSKPFLNMLSRSFTYAKSYIILTNSEM